MDSQPDVSLLMPAYNAADTIGPAIEAVLKLETDLDVEVVVVDDGSRDSTSEIVKSYADKHPEKVRLIRKGNGGGASALNAACKNARGSRYWAIVEADVEVPPEWVTELSGEVEKEGVIGAGGLIIPDRKDSWIARLHGYEIAFKIGGRKGFVDHITAANAFYRREAFDIATPFEENLRNSIYDVNFNLRLREAGHKLVARNDITAVHHYKSSLFGFLARNYAYARYRPWLIGKALPYPYDRWLVFNVLLTCAWMASIAFAMLWWPVPLIGLAFLLLLQVPLSVLFVVKHRDWAPILFPLVMWLRNSVAVVGLGIGTIAKFFDRGPKPDNP